MVSQGILVKHQLNIFIRPAIEDYAILQNVFVQLFKDRIVVDFVVPVDIVISPLCGNRFWFEGAVGYDQ